VEWSAKCSGRGAVTLQGPSSRTPPKIDPNYLATAEDRKVAVQSIRHARMLLDAEAFSVYEPEEYELCHFRISGVLIQDFVFLWFCGCVFCFLFCFVFCFVFMFVSKEKLQYVAVPSRLIVSFSHAND
jgi:hypothetical protein